MRELDIETYHWVGPAARPGRCYNWTAHFRNYAPGVGYGTTEEEAVADLLAQSPDHPLLDTAAVISIAMMLTAAYICADFVITILT